MLKQCRECGNWFYEDTNVCQECGENENIEKFDETELVEILNDYEFVIRNLKVVQDKNGTHIESKFGTQKKGKYTSPFKLMCRLIDWSKVVSNELYRVVNTHTKKELFVGTLEKCETFVKIHKGDYIELTIKDWYAK